MFTFVVVLAATFSQGDARQLPIEGRSREPSPRLP
jgi:hypothetical protein